MESIEPATGQAYATLPESDARDVDAAVSAAERALPGWSGLPANERSRHLIRLAELIERDLEPLARAESTDTGKPIGLARSMDIPRSAANFRFFSTAILHAASQMHRTDAPAPAGAGTRSVVALNYTLRPPLGVVALISPWNLPLYLLSWKIAPALACGNTAVCKPSEVTPMTAHMLADISIEAGLPPGVLNIVHGTGGSAGAPLVSHPRVKAVSFTGGTATGKAIAAAAAPAFKKMSLELGGKNATVVFDDADLAEVVPEVVRASFTNQGQVCLCGSRVLVHRRVYAEFLRAFISRTAALRSGDPLDEETQQGAIVSSAHYAKICAAIERAVAEGGTIECGGRRPEGLSNRCQGGYFLTPAVISGLSPDCATMQEEIFGPVVSVTPFDSEDDAVRIANGTRYGLSASLWTRDVSRAHRVSERLEAGTIWINCWLVRDLRVPFGGMKDSGVGREGGDEAIRFFTECKNVCVRI